MLIVNTDANSQVDKNLKYLASERGLERVRF